MKYQLTRSWSLELEEGFQRRVEDGDLVLWGPGRTLRIAAWGDGKKPRFDEAIRFVREEAAADREDVLEERSDGLYRFAYRLVELDEDRSSPRYALYSFTVVDGFYLQMAAYFDDAKDGEWAEGVARSVSFRPVQ